jgi:hypothetical protein
MAGRFAGHSMDLPWDEEYHPESYEYSVPFLAPEELGDFYALSEEQWEIEEQALAEGWDFAPDYVEPELTDVFACGDYIDARPIDDVDWAEANHVYLGKAALEWIKFLDSIRWRRNFNPPKRHYTRTVIVAKKEVPAEPPRPIKKTVVVWKRITPRHSKREVIPITDLPLYKYRGWKEVGAEL